MKTIFFGTLHGGHTPHKDLEEILSDIKPDQIFVELTKDEVENMDDGKSIRDEMIFIWKWAEKNNIIVDHFDINSGGLKEGVTGKELGFKKLVDQMSVELEKYSWKELNKKEPWQTSPLLDIQNEIEDKFYDQEKFHNRDMAMLSNINNKIISDGVVVVFTGT